MALVVKDRVQETTTTTGTGTLTLAGAKTDFQSFAAIGDGNTTFYSVAGTQTDEWEVGIGTYTASGTTLSRDTVLASSNSGSLVNFSAGEKNVFCTYPAGKSLYEDASGDVSISGGATITGDVSISGGATITGDASAKHVSATQGILLNANSVTENYTLPTNYNGLSAGPVTVDPGVTVTVPSGQTWVVV